MLQRASASQGTLRAFGVHSSRRRTRRKRSLPRQPGERHDRSPRRGVAPDREAPLPSQRPKARAERAGVDAAGVGGAEQACMRARRSLRFRAAEVRLHAAVDALRVVRRDQLAAWPLLGTRRSGEHRSHSVWGFPRGALLALGPQGSNRVRRRGQADVAMSRAVSLAKAPVGVKPVQPGART